MTGVDFENRYDYDLHISLNGIEFTVEVKLDKMASVTGNIAIEFYNPYQGKDSGLSSSKADFWAHLVYEKGNVEIWFCPLKKLKEWISANHPKRIISQGGDNNASLYLYDKYFILDSTFVRVDTLSADDFLKGLPNV